MSEEILDPTLLTLLACPQDKGPLQLVHDDNGAGLLYNPRLGVAYPIDNGIPVLLADEARTVSDDEQRAFAVQG